MVRTNKYKKVSERELFKVHHLFVLRDAGRDVFKNGYLLINVKAIQN